MSLLFAKITKEYLQQQAKEPVYRTGRHYFLADRVRITRLRDESCEARVFDDSLMFVNIVYDTEKDAIRFSCDCGRNGKGLCEHQVAAGLALESRSRFERQNSGGDDTRAPATAERDKRAATANRTRPKRALVRRLKPWQNFLQQIEDLAPPEAANWVAVFFLETRHSYWLIHARKAFVKKDGTLGKVTRLREDDLENEILVLNEKERFAVSYLAATTQLLAPVSHPPAYARRSAVFKAGTSTSYIFELLRHSRLFLDKKLTGFTNPLRISPEKGRIHFPMQAEGNDIVCRPRLVWAGVDEVLSPEYYFFSQRPVWLLRRDTIIQLESPQEFGSIAPFLQKPYSLKVPKKELPAFLAEIERKPDFSPHLVFSEELAIREVQEEVAPRLYLEERGNLLHIELRFGYAEYEFTGPGAAAFGYKAMPNKRGLVRVLRNPGQEKQLHQEVLETGVHPAGGNRYFLPEDQAIHWLLEGARSLTDSGFELHGEKALQRFSVRFATPKIKLIVRSKIDWFDLQLVVDFDGIVVPLQELKKALKAGRTFIQLADGSTSRIPDKWLRRFSHLFALGETAGDSVKLSRCHATLIDILAEEADALQADAVYANFVKRLKNFSGISQAAPPASLHGTLRPYQMAGFSWLLFLQQYGFGGCLADDMGLGKTVQALTLLLHEKEKHGSSPTLIIAPRSVIFNWHQEVRKFAPSLRVLRYEGPERKALAPSFPEVDVVLATYGILRRDISVLKEHKFRYIILDESQFIKNPASLTAKATRLLQSDYRLVLTGTPIENNTLELWSQMAFLNPGMLGSRRYFQSAFATPIEKRTDEAAAQLLQKMIFPFILRRKKDQVEKDLPPKSESVFYAGMLPGQEKLYDYWRDYYRATILNAIEAKGLANSRIAVLEGLMKLRQIACHPQLTEPHEQRSSGKFEAVKEQLAEILLEGHKVLVFSQFVKMLTLMRQYLDAEQIAYEYLDGRTVDREACVKNFQENEKIRLFLISLRAGGTGLNLTAADYVIHYDPWWNPAVEMQATDRTHRIGQEKHVFVYKFITRGTVEEKVLELQSRKQALADHLITTDRAFFKHLTKDDIQLLFA